MVHYGRACTASWQMLRHASVQEPAGRGRGRKDAVATQHRLAQAFRHAHRRAHTKSSVCCSMTWTEKVLESCPSTNTHVSKVDSLYFFLCAASAQIDCDQPSANIALSQCAKCAAHTKRQRPAVFPLQAKQSGISHQIQGSLLHRVNRSTTSTACDVSLLIMVPPRARPLLHQYAHLCTGSFSSTFTVRLDLIQTHGLSNTSYLHSGLHSSRIFYNQAACSFMEEAPPQDQTVCISVHHSPPSTPSPPSKTFRFTGTHLFLPNLSV